MELFAWNTNLISQAQEPGLDTTFIRPERKLTTRGMYGSANFSRQPYPK